MLIKALQSPNWMCEIGQSGIFSLTKTVAFLPQCLLVSKISESSTLSLHQGDFDLSQSILICFFWITHQSPVMNPYCAQLLF